MDRDCSVRLFRAGDQSTGITTAEIGNWTGHVFFSRRANLANLLNRAGVQRTGVYLLVWLDPSGQARPKVYIGESDNVGQRLVSHNREEAKNFWNHVCVVTSKDTHLTKTHVLYLESRLLCSAAECGQCTLMNDQMREYGQLPEADRAEMEVFIEHIRVVLPMLGLRMLEGPARTEPAFRKPSPLVTTASSKKSLLQELPVFELTSQKLNLSAIAREIDGDFTVLAGSQARIRWSGTKDHSYYGLFQKLVEDAVIVRDGNGRRCFARDYVFPSPSGAAAIIYGHPMNGRVKWRLKGTDKTYADWHAERSAKGFRRRSAARSAATASVRA